MNTLKDRFYHRLRKDENGCLIWAGAKNQAGYGNIYIGSENGKIITDMTHRVAWKLSFGEIPENIFVLHHCDNPSCCNPEHLFLGTQSDNMQDKSKKGRAKPGPVSKTEWWTPEKREERGQVTKKWKNERREAAAIAAGVPPEWRLCPVCKTWKPRDGFGNNSARPDGLHAQCKPCKNELNIERVRCKKGIITPRRKTRSDKKYFK